MPAITDPHVILIALFLLAWLGLALSTDALNPTEQPKTNGERA